MRGSRVVAVCSVAMGLLTMALMGCGDQETAGTASPGKPTMAYEFRDDVPAYFDEQRACPVCGGEPIKKDINAEYQGKRIYFDKEECANQFKENPQEHIQKWMERVQKEQQEQAEEMRRQEEGGG